VAHSFLRHGECFKMLALIKIDSNNNAQNVLCSNVHVGRCR